MNRKLKKKMKNVDVGRYNDLELSFSIITSAIFWYFLPYIFFCDRNRYYHYLKSYIWNYRRRKRLIKDNFACTMCGSTTTTLDIHHLNYDRIFKEKTEDLRTVCRYHHKRIHGR